MKNLFKNILLVIMILISFIIVVFSYNNNYELVLKVGFIPTILFISLFIFLFFISINRLIDRD